ncbi:hypothetical protein IFR05_004818 [Cadophora sp. M221]|nr:hypothetical protein IFR05_004818 [Cadophora sp. M221]
MSDTSSVLSGIDSEQFSNVESLLSDVDSEQFNDLELDRDFSVTTLAEPGSHDAHNWDEYSSRMSFRLSDPASDHIFFLGTHEYERSMYELDDTIIVDAGAMSRGRERILVAEKRLPRSDKKKGNKKKDTEDNTATEEGDATETGTDEEVGSAEKKRITNSRKRKRGASDSEYMTEEADDTVEGGDGDDADYTGSEDMDSGAVRKTSRSSPKKRGFKTRPPAMGRFNPSSSSCNERLSRNNKGKDKELSSTESEVDVEDQIPEASNTPLSDEEIAEAAQIKELELSFLTDKPPPNGWYGGTPTRNGQWTICVTPPKPTWHHPDWDAARRKEADEFTRQKVKHGKEIMERDIKEGMYRRRTHTGDVLLVTRRTVVWWQCHYYRGRKSWAINVALEGYDEY